MGSDGGQGEAVRVPYADGTLIGLPDGLADADLVKILALSDVMSTGHHAAVSARVRPGGTVAVVGDGAVGLCGVLAARRLGAERIIALGRHRDRTAIARDFGATDVVPERGADAVDAGSLPVFDQTVDLAGVPGGYAAMAERTALKVLVRL